VKAERREFRNARFSPEVIKEAAEIFDKELETEAKEAPSLLLSVDVDDARRDHDSEAEFYADIADLKERLRTPGAFGFATIPRLDCIC